jgi:hypothetical protein
MTQRKERLAAMTEAVANYEAEFGLISEGELIARARADRGAAVVIRQSGRANRCCP